LPRSCLLKLSCIYLTCCELNWLVANQRQQRKAANR
jgi:hypothetical protein